MKYEVFTTEQAAADLRAIFEYIAYDLLAGQNALNQLDRLEQAILSLDEMPERYHLYDKEPWKERNLRIMPVDGYLVFYIPRSEEKTVTVIRVMYGRRDIDAQLKQTKLSENLTNSECANTATKRKMPVSVCAGMPQAVQRGVPLRTVPLFLISVGFSYETCACLGARARQRAGDGAASAVPSALPPTCIKTVTYFYGQSGLIKILG